MTAPIKAGSLKNRIIGDSCTGYSFELGTLSYRGSWLSTIEGIRLVVDGEEVPQGDILFRLRGMCFTIENLPLHTEVFWGATDRAELSVNRVKGLSPGRHTVELEILKRSDFGHSFGDAEKGYENAVEFHKPQLIRDSAELYIGEDDAL